MRDIFAEWPLPYEPHDFILEWLGHVMDGEHFIGLTATGDGKTCMFFFPLIIMLYAAKHGVRVPGPHEWPQNPFGIIVCPITAIEDELVM